MTSIDTLISNAETRAARYASATDFLVGELRGFVHAFDPTIIKDAVLDVTKVALPTYAPPIKDATAMPVYEPPTAALPTAPSLASIGAITLPQIRVAPTLNTEGLFGQVAPSSNIPDFIEAAPDLGIDSIIAEMNALITPELVNIEMPVLTQFSIGPAPTLDIPGYDAPLAPEAIRDPVDYSVSFDAAYRQMLPEMQAFIDDKLSVWVTNYAPEYASWTAQLQAKVTEGMNGGVLPDQFEAALFIRAQGRVAQEFSATEDTLLAAHSKGGFIAPPGTLMSGLFTARLKGAEALSNQATDIYIERRKTEVQHTQLVMNLASAQIQSVRNNVISYAGVLASTMQTSLAYANSIADKLEKLYDHLIARSQLSIAIMQVMATQYEVRLKAALASLDGYKLQLEAERLKKDIEAEQIKLVEAQIDVQELNIKRYSAILEALERKSSVQELKMKGYSIRADVFKTQTQAKVASFEVYKSALQGDQAKLEGELSKLKIFETQLQSDNLLLEAQVKSIEATEASNNVKAKIFELGGEVYKLDAQAAIQKFTAYAEVKKLTQGIYGQELNNAIESFKANLEIPKIMLEAMIKEYELKVETAIKEASIDVQKLSISEQASAQAVTAFQNMASSALGSLNSVASSATQAAA